MRRSEIVKHRRAQVHGDSLHFQNGFLALKRELLKHLVLVLEFQIRFLEQMPLRGQHRFRGAGCGPVRAARGMRQFPALRSRAASSVVFP